jgi:hypothetical protein
MTNGVLFYNHDTDWRPSFGCHRQEAYLNAILHGKSNADTETDLNSGDDGNIYAHKVY